MKRTLLALLALSVVCMLPGQVFAAEEVVFLHYFSGTLAGGIDELVNTFNAENPQYNLRHTSVDHEAFKTSIRVTLSGGNPPDLFSYWAGARVQFIVDADRLEPIDSARLPKCTVMPASTTASYNIFCNFHRLMPTLCSPSSRLVKAASLDMATSVPSCRIQHRYS